MYFNVTKKIYPTFAALFIQIQSNKDKQYAYINKSKLQLFKESIIMLLKPYSTYNCSVTLSGSDEPLACIVTIQNINLTTEIINLN